MNRYIADLHVHSKYSRATARDMDIRRLAEWAKIKGISLMGTGDFTHPQWFAELKGALRPKADGIYTYDGTDFILSAEVSNIYRKAERTRKVHNIILAPDLETAGEVNRYLRSYGMLESDGRPMLDLPCSKMARGVFRINPDCLIIPAHAWTPHFSVFGSNSGFDTFEECFEDQSANIYSLETGLSSDPAMNWRWSALDRFTLVSNSDAHSPSKIGREANVFNAPFTYKELQDILKKKDRERFLYTIEFFPEEGKYHWDGHRPCGQRLSPKETKLGGYLCPACGKKVTVGVMNRVESLCDREEGFKLDGAPNFRNMIPLAEIIAEALGVGPDTLSVRREYNELIRAFGTEFGVLLDLPEEDVKKRIPHRVAEGILRVREGKVSVEPGYDGVYGKTSIFADGDEDAEKAEQQMEFF